MSRPIAKKSKSAKKPAKRAAVKEKRAPHPRKPPPDLAQETLPHIPPPVPPPVRETLSDANASGRLEKHTIRLDKAIQARIHALMENPDVFGVAGGVRWTDALRAMVVHGVQACEKLAAERATSRARFRG